MGFSVNKFAQHPAGAAVLGGLPAAIVSIICVIITIVNNSSSQNRQVELDLVAKFDQSSNQIVNAGSMFLSAINNSKNLDESKKFIATLSGTQIIETESLKHAFGDVAEIDSYQNAVKEFQTVASSTRSAEDIKVWAESFGKVVDAKISLTNKLYNKLGMKA
jgi:hypothetical protein